MRSPKAPIGQHTDLRVTVTLANGNVLDFFWTTPIALAPAMHKAPRWATEAMSKEKTRGRNSIVGFEVVAKYKPGDFDSLPGDEES